MVHDAVVGIPVAELDTGGANAPVFQVNGASFPSGMSAGAARFQQLIADGIPLDALVVNKEADVVVVSFHGSTNRRTTTLPRFERLRSLVGESVSSVFFSDPTLHLDPNIWLTWFTGWGSVDVPSIIAEWSEAIASMIGARKIIFTGSSGGGFAALQVSGKVAGSAALAFHAQTDIGRFVVGQSLSQQRDYVRVVWPSIWDQLGGREGFVGGGWTLFADSRVSAIQAYGVPRPNRVYILQNIEEPHYGDHFLPFLNSAWHGGNFDNIVPWVNRQGSGHVVPTTDVFAKYLRMAVELEGKLG